MCHVIFVIRGKHIRVNSVLRKRLHGKRRNEFQSAFCHDDFYMGTCFHKPAGQFRRFVSRNASGDSKNNFLIFQHMVRLPEIFD